jgi:predicted PurR-regulated permease PerM
MSEFRDSSIEGQLTGRVLEATIRIGLVVLLVAWCFQIVRPFLVPTIWGVIIAVAAYPTFARLQGAFGGRPVPAAVAFTLIALIVLILPAALLSGTLVEGVQDVVAWIDGGGFKIPAPPPSVQQWPLVGDWVYGLWSQASQNVAGQLKTILPQLKGVGHWLLATVAGAGLALLQFIFAVVIAGALLAHAEAAQRTSDAIARRLAGQRGADFAGLADATVRSVTRGILGVSPIQALLAGLGFLAVGVPAAGLWALVALLLSVVQIGIFPVVVPVLIYVFSTVDTGTAVLFLVWSLFVGTIDNVLKPLLLGRGVPVPMLVIFIGAIGGFLSSGIIGLFVGAVVLVLGYKLFLAWLHPEEPVSRDVLSHAPGRSPEG